MKKFKGDLKGFPVEIVEMMTKCQEQQGNKMDVSVFEENRLYSFSCGGFFWEKTKEGIVFWERVLCLLDFKLFYSLYPKQKVSLFKKVLNKIINIFK